MTFGFWQADLLGQEELQGVPCLVFANKQDLLGALNAAQIMGGDEGLDITQFRDRWIHVEGCSAKTGVGLDEGFGKLMAQTKKS